MACWNIELISDVCWLLWLLMFSPYMADIFILLYLPYIALVKYCSCLKLLSTYIKFLFRRQAPAFLPPLPLLLSSPCLSLPSLMQTLLQTSASCSRLARFLFFLEFIFWNTQMLWPLGPNDPENPDFSGMVDFSSATPGPDGSWCITKVLKHS